MAAEPEAGVQQGTVVSPDGLTLRYEVEGPRDSGAPSLLCAAGGPGRASEYLGDLGGLAARRRIVRLDTRGTGRSQAPDDPAGYAPERLVADLEAVRADLGEERVDLLGHSAGGPVALAYAAEHPDRVRRLVLVTTYLQPGPEADEEREALKASRADEPWYAEAREAEDGMRYARPAEQQRLSRSLRPFYYGVWDERTAAHANAADHQMSPRAEAGISVHWRTAAERADELLAIEAPTLVVLGALDVITPPSGGRRMAERLRSAEVVVLDGVGHFPWVDGAAAFSKAVGDYLDAA
jgi:pimeloyl-ACP methyl ester carboxylesterase